METSNTDSRVHAIVQGYVQGVNFRYYTVRTARQLGVRGWVANRQDGTVETVAEGPRDALEAFVDFLHEGSPSASVQDVDVEWRTPTSEFDDFRVRYP
jgi:acylphosphatase